MQTGGFPRSRRLRHSADFARVFAHPIKRNAVHLTVLARRNDRAAPRLGMVVSKRNVKSAVARNHLKRRAREAFRHIQSQLGGVDLIFISRPGLEANLTLAQDITRTFQAAAAQCVIS